MISWNFPNWSYNKKKIKIWRFNFYKFVKTDKLKMIKARLEHDLQLIGKFNDLCVFGVTYKHFSS